MSQIEARYWQGSLGTARRGDEKRNREKRRSQESAFQGLLRIEPQKPTQIKSPVSAGLLLK
jgi:hypothetical protein